MTTISRAAKVFSYILQILPKLKGNDVKMNAVKRIRFWTSAKCTLSFSVNGNNDFGYLHLLYVIKVLELDILQVSTRANHYRYKRASEGYENLFSVTFLRFYFEKYWYDLPKCHSIPYHKFISFFIPRLTFKRVHDPYSIKQCFPIKTQVNIINIKQYIVWKTQIMTGRTATHIFMLRFV